MDFNLFSAAQSEDSQVQGLGQQPGRLILQDVPIHGVSMLYDLSTGHPRFVVPPSWIRTIFDTFHSLCHPRPKPAIRTISVRYVWPCQKKRREKYGQNRPLMPNEQS